MDLSFPEPSRRNPRQLLVALVQSMGLGRLHLGQAWPEVHEGRINVLRDGG